MPFDCSHVYTIEEKLAIGHPLSLEEDVEPVRNLVTTFYKVWQLYNEYPELNSKIDESLFRAVFDAMASKLCCSTANVSSEEDLRVAESNSNSTPAANDQKTIASVYIECPQCANKFLLLNNDPEYAFYKHSLEPEHIEAIKSLEKLNSVSIEATRPETVSVAAPHTAGASSSKNISMGTLQPIKVLIDSEGGVAIERGLCESSFDGDVIFMDGHIQIVRQKARRGGRQKEPAASTSIANANKNKGEHKEDQWIQKRGNGKYCLLCEVKLPGESQLRSHVNGQLHQQNAPWVKIHGGNRYSCTLCHASNMSLEKLYEHLEGKRHETKLDELEKKGSTQNKPSEPLKSTNFFDISVSSPVNIYRISEESRMAYFLNKICFSTDTIPAFVSSAGNTSSHAMQMQLSYGCLLCNAGFIEVESHMFEGTHRSRIAEIIKKSDPKTVSFEMSILWGKGKKCRMCFLCNVKLPENEPYLFFNHISSSYHMNRVKSRFRSPRFKEWERGIVLRNGMPYCVFCEVVLHNEDSMLEHISNPAHVTKLN